MTLIRILPALLLAACAAGGPGDAPSAETLAARETPPDLTVWPADLELRLWVETVAPRIEAATGLRVVASDDYSGVPLFWSDAGSDDGWQGLAHSDAWGRPTWLAIELGTPVAIREAVVLHELLHALGAEHVETGEGVMSPELWGQSDDWPLTSADLESLCAGASCAAFTPEAPRAPGSTR